MQFFIDRLHTPVVLASACLGGVSSWPWWGWPFVIAFCILLLVLIGFSVRDVCTGGPIRRHGESA